MKITKILNFLVYNRMISLIEPFTFIRKLGRGDIGTVYLCEQNNILIALKEYYYLSDSFFRELKTIRYVSSIPDLSIHFNKYYDHLITPDLVLLASEYIEGQSPDKIDLVSQIISDVILVVEKFHSYGVIHGDLSLDNIKIAYSKQIVLLDFEYSCIYDKWLDEQINQTINQHNSLLTSLPGHEWYTSIFVQYHTSKLAVNVHALDIKKKDESIIYPPHYIKPISI